MLVMKFRVSAAHSTPPADDPQFVISTNSLSRAGLSRGHAKRAILHCARAFVRRHPQVRLGWFVRQSRENHAIARIYDAGDYFHDGP